jgi:hypothetical protein
MLPREHGSWAMMAAPALVGWAAAGGGPAGAGAFFLLALLGAFLSRTPLTALLATPGDARALRWLAFYAACAAVGLAGLLAVYGRRGLLPLGLPAGAVLAASLWFTARRRAMTEVHELIGVAGLSLAAPGAHVAAVGVWSADAAWLWALCALFLSGPVFHVKMLVLGRVASAPGAPAAAVERADAAVRQSELFHAASAGAVLLGVLAAGLPWLALVPFLGAWAKTVYYAHRRGARLELKTVGWQEVVWTVVFVAVSAAGFQ